MNVQGYLKKGEPWSIDKTREPKQLLEYPQRYMSVTGLSWTWLYTR